MVFKYPNSTRYRVDCFLRSGAILRVKAVKTNVKP